MGRPVSLMNLEWESLTSELLTLTPGISSLTSEYSPDEAWVCSKEAAKWIFLFRLKINRFFLHPFSSYLLLTASKQDLCRSIKPIKPLLTRWHRPQTPEFTGCSNSRNKQHLNPRNEVPLYCWIVWEINKSNSFQVTSSGLVIPRSRRSRSKQHCHQYQTEQ